jgi:hypothetical protein
MVQPIGFHRSICLLGHIVWPKGSDHLRQATLPSLDHLAAHENLLGIDLATRHSTPTVSRAGLSMQEDRQTTTLSKG